MEICKVGTNSRLPASRFPDPADLYFCDNCGRDLTKRFHTDTGSVWQPICPAWFVCECGRKYLSGASEWDDLTAWERRQRLAQLKIGFALFAILIIPVTLSYLALRYGGAARFAVLAIALVPSILVAKPFALVVLDLFEIVTSIWRTRVRTELISEAVRTWLATGRSRLHQLRFTPVAAVIAVFLISTRWIPTHSGPPPQMSFLAPEPTVNAAQPEILPVAEKPPALITRQGKPPGAPSPAFKRVQVGPNEVDYVSEDVTIRHFRPNPEPRPHASYKQVHAGPDVTMRSFGSDVTMRYVASKEDLRETR